MKVRKIQKIIYSEIRAPSLIALAVLTFVVFTREFGRLAEMLIRKDAAAFTIFKVVLSLLPGILIFTVPFAFLIGTLIGISRLSSDSEIVAMRANGVSTYQMIWPVLKAGLLVAFTTLLLTFVFLPQGSWALRQIQHQIGLRPVQSQIKPLVFNEDLPGVVLYVEDIELRSSRWKGVFMADTSIEGEKRIILADSAYPLFSADGHRLQLNFNGGSIYKVDPGFPEKYSLARFQTLDVPIDFPITQQANTVPKESQDKTLRELSSDLNDSNSETYRLGLIELQRRFSLSFSALIFAVLGVTLGIHSPRGSSGFGFIISVAIAFGYYLLFATGVELAENKTLSIVWGVWGANILIGLAALLSLRYSEQESSIFRTLQSSPVWNGLVWAYQNLFGAMGRLFRQLFYQIRLSFLYLVDLRPHFARIIDLYIFRTCLFYMLLTLLICTSLFYLFTFFELIDDIFANHLSYSLVLEYLFYLFPYVLVRLVPISILIAALVAFGLLDRTNQFIALRSCGISVYRIAVPVLTLALMLSGFVFVLQEYVLPYANQRQDNLRNIIKGRPAQTHYQLGFSWIFGEDNRLYNYNYFDSANDVFAEISIYQLDIQENQLFQHIYARRAQWDVLTQTWVLNNGWERRFSQGRIKFSAFHEMRFSVMEGPSYFKKGVKESSKMAYGELQEYISALKQGGFEVDHLKTELYKKISFPFVNFIMSILGIPFAFTLGRKGTLYGMAAGVLLGIAYWGAFGVFEVMGSSGLLSPLLAAWGPNLIFGAGGVLMLSTVRT